MLLSFLLVKSGTPTWKQMIAVKISPGPAAVHKGLEELWGAGWEGFLVWGQGGSLIYMVHQTSDRWAGFSW